LSDRLLHRRCGSIWTINMGRWRFLVANYLLFGILGKMTFEEN